MDATICQSAFGLRWCMDRTQHELT